MSKFKVGDEVIFSFWFANERNQIGVIYEVPDFNKFYYYKVKTENGFMYVKEELMRHKTLDDATPAEHDAVNYYKKLDEKLPDDYWDESRIDTIGQNGNTGEHYESVSKPKHYQILDTEAIDLIADTLSKDEFHGYCLGNILKYRLRAGKKGNALEDLAKADEYEKIYERYYGESND